MAPSQRHGSLLRAAIVVAFFVSRARCNESGPVLTEEPNNRVDFSNTTGVTLRCAVRGRPDPSIVWVRADNGSPVGDVPGLRKVLSNGNLIFPPFRAEDYRQEVHAQVYQCVASNPHGTVHSRDVHVRAVLAQDYETHVSNKYVVMGSVAVLKCVIPFYVSDFVNVHAWMTDTGEAFYPSEKYDGKYLVLPSGELHIKSVSPEDGFKSYKCRTVHRLTQETRLSATAGRLVIADPVGTIGPRLRGGTTARFVVAEGEATSLPCEMQAYPIPSFRWYKFSEGSRKSPVELGDRVKQVGGTLIISMAKVEDSGKYLCVVSNSVGSDSVETDLTVTAPLSTLVEPEVQTVELGRPASFKCTYAGNPVKSVTWLKDGNPLNHKEELLRIESVGRGDKGMYQCFVRNDQESVQATAELKLGGRSRNKTGLPVSLPSTVEPPQLTYAFQERTLQPGPSVFLKCVVAGNPTPEITWELDGKRLTNSDRMQVGQYVTVNGEVVSHLNISAIHTNDGGYYACVASSTVGSVRHAARLNVYGLPYIRTMDKVAVVAGENMVVNCPVAGYPIDSIVWEKNGRLLPINRRQSTFPNGTLVVEGVQRTADQGRYTCVARNTQGYTARGDLDVQVMVPPRWITEPEDKAFALGSDAHLECKADGFPKPSLSWKKGAGLQPGYYRDLDSNNPNVRVTDDGILHITNIQKSSQGYYLCEANNGIGAGLTAVIYVRVQASPQFKIQYRNQTARHDEDAVLECEAEGETPIGILWSKDNHNIDQSAEPRYTIREEMQGASVHSSLSIKNTDRSDSAVYTCVATNAFGRADANINLIIQERPELPSSLKVLDKSGRSVELSWTPPYEGNSPITRYIVEFKVSRGNWETDAERVIIPGNQNIAAVLNLRPATLYHFRVLARNKIGDSDPSNSAAIITAEEAPSGPPCNLKVEAVDQLSLRVSWEPPLREEWGGDILGYYVGYRLASSSRSYVFETVEFSLEMGKKHHLNISQLDVYTEYAVVVQAFNKIGSGPMTKEVRAYTAEGTPQKPPHDVSCNTLSSQSIHMTWSSPPAETVQGMLKGYKVIYGPSEQWFDGKDIKRTRSMETHLHGLMKYTNYSMEVLAFTSGGDGVRSNTIHCQTDQDIPEAPASVKALVKSSESVLLLWKPPKRPNGIITQYTVYFKEHGKADRDALSKKLPPSQKTYEVTGLQHEDYVVWVTASTTFGEGKPSQSVRLKPSDKVPGKIASFGGEYVVNYKEDVELECQAVGIPSPDMRWTVHGEIFEGDNRIHVLPGGSLLIHQLSRNDSGEYTCHVENAYGHDTLTYTLIIQAPPHPPEIIFHTITAQSIEVEMKPFTDDDATSIHGYKLYYKYKYGEWENVQVPASTRTYILENLWCGSSYQIYASAHNDIGSSEPSEVVYRKTRGSRPKAPEVHEFVEVSSASITLHLDTWDGGLCPINYFVLEYKTRYQEDWTLLSNQVKPSGNYVIFELTPATRYILRISAYNNVGSSTAEYECTTLSRTGGFITTPVTPEVKIISTTSNTIEVMVKPSTVNNTTPIRGYTLYYKSVSNDWENVKFPASADTYVLENLLCGFKYQIYASAYNDIGTSQLSSIIYTRTKGKIPKVPEAKQFIEASSTFFTLHLNAWGDGGCPIYNFEVEYKARHDQNWTLASNQVRPLGNYVIMELNPATMYHLRVSAHNSVGYSVAEYECTTLTLTDRNSHDACLISAAPPHPPKVKVISATTSIIKVKMKPSTSDNITPILGYTLYYKPEFSKWENVQVPASTRKYVLENLWCGSRYQIYVTAYNKIGTSRPSRIINTSTEGKKPEVPEMQQFVEVSTRSITLHLDTWGDGGCPINYFTVEYRERYQEDWIMASNQVKPSGNYAIFGLTPATWYNLRIFAYNNAGSSVAEYECSTLT